LLKFGELRVADVMVPRANIDAVEQSMSLAEVVSAMYKAGHSRLPVFRDTLDDIVGMVHVRDLLRYWDTEESFALDEIVRRILFVPPSMRVRELLMQMRATRIHMAIVVDEYGGTDGLVTIADLVEEIVGEIQDEHGMEDLPMLVDRPDGLIEADARVSVEDLEARVGTVLLPEEHEENIETLGGLVFSLVGRVPARGELIAHPAGLQFEVIDADPRRIKRLRIHHAPPPPE
jgi:CBS domain containing-hemolysin-like protein